MIKKLLIEVIVLKEALITLLAVLEEKGILTKGEQFEILDAIEMKLRAKE